LGCRGYGRNAVCRADMISGTATTLTPTEIHFADLEIFLIGQSKLAM